MDDLRRLEAKGLARAKIRSKRRRVSTIRRRTVRGSLALFAVLWGVIFVQLVSGNDPVLSRIKTAHAQAATPAEAKKAAHSQSSAATAPPEPESESELESELGPERGAEGGAEAGAEPGGEAPSELEREPEPRAKPEPAAPLVTSAS